MKRTVLLIATAVVCSCGSTYTEVTDLKVYYDTEKTKIKEDGTLINGLEEGAWNYYSEKGKIIKQGTYKDGLQDGRWYYDMPNIDKEIVWQKVEIRKLNFSLPINFIYKEEMSDSSNYIYRDTQQHSLLKISIVEDCSKICVAGYYDLTLKALQKSNAVLSSNSLKIESKNGYVFLDNYLLNNRNQDSLRQLMLYKGLSDKNAIIFTIVDLNKNTEYIKFIVTEVFNHVKYDYERVMPSNGEMTVYDMSK